MPKKPSNQHRDPEEIGKTHSTNTDSNEQYPSRPGTERARDEQREDRGPTYGGDDWKVADERGDRRFGHARNDDSDPSELSKGMHAVDDDEWPGNDASVQTDATGEDPDVASRARASDDGETENGGQRAGFGRGEKPTKAKARAKKNPHPGAKRR